MRLCGAAAVIFLLAGCGRYTDFSLPAPSGEVRPVQPVFTAQPTAVMEPAPGWESADVLNPSVVARGDRLLNVYSAYDGKTWHTGTAESTDGLHWESRKRMLSPDQPWEGSYIAANGAALMRGGEVLYWYQAGEPPRIGLARSWVKQPQPVLDTGPRGSWDERGVADPYVIEAGGALYMFYLGQNRARQQRLGLARSTDGGVTWTKLRSNPILEIGPEGAFDENGLGEPAVWQSEGRWWMLYTGRDRQENRRLGLALSRDGVHWQRYSESAVFSGTQPWNLRVVCDPTLLADPRRPGVLRMWFGGGDVPHPAENIHGRIGYAELQMVPAP
jgi:predicted GH43/DUF377 family glycosyl hydrolase